MKFPLLKGQKGQKGQIISTYEGRLFSLSPWALALLQLQLQREEVTSTSSPAQSKSKILFVGGHSDESAQAEILLKRIVLAMNLAQGDFAHCQLARDVPRFVKTYLPQVIISFGAIATNALLEQRKRLSQVHGKFFEQTFSLEEGFEWTCDLVPIFHPDFLAINPSMKRTAWTDLQKVMKKVGTWPSPSH